MRSKIFVVVLSLTFFCTISGQEVSWVQDVQKWTYSVNRGDFTAPSQPFNLYVSRDTLFGDTLAKVILGDNKQIPEDENNFSVIVYAQGDTLFRRVDGKFYLLYDASLEVGDTLKIYTDPRLRNPRVSDPFVYHIVDSVGTYNLNGLELKKQFIRPLDIMQHEETFGGWHYQFIGNIDGFFVPGTSGIYCEAGCPYGLRCFSATKERELKLVNFDCDAIDYGTAIINVPDFSHQLQVFPNPVRKNETMMVEWKERPRGIEPQIALRDVSGRQLNMLIQTKENGFTLQSPTLPAGLYFLSINWPEGMAVKKLVVR